MIKLFFYNSNDKLSTEAYNYLKANSLDVTCVEITGRNVADRVKRLGITQVPTLYIKSKGNIRMLIGKDIVNFFDTQTESDDSSSMDEEFDNKVRKARQSKDVKIKDSEEDSEVESVEIVQSTKEKLSVADIIEKNKEMYGD